MFEDKVYRRDAQFEGTNWLWPVGDDGSWDGPTNDWINSHKEKYFKYINGTDTVITAGANCGLYAKQYANKFNKVYAFEPYPLSFYCLVNNVQEENVIKLQAALGSEIGLCKPIVLSESNLGMNKIEHGNYLIPIFNIDSLPLSSLNLLQLDVEGHEYDILLGAKKTIEKFKPVIILENGDRQEIINLLSVYGYKIVDRSISDVIYAI